MIEILNALKQEDNLRELKEVVNRGLYIEHEGISYLNMSSNDYLGITSMSLHKTFLKQLLNESENSECDDEISSQIDSEGRAGAYDLLCAKKRSEFLLSNPSSRLMTGNSHHYTVLEQDLAAMYGGREVLVLGSGFLVNSGVLSALTTKKDLILADKLVHASVIDGLRLCEAEWHRFNHNDMEHLENLIIKYRGDFRNVWVVTESVFSMDGDIAPIAQLIELKTRYDLKLYVDEAHAFGVFGVDAGTNAVGTGTNAGFGTCAGVCSYVESEIYAGVGAGVAAQLGLDSSIDIIVATLGKAAASQGGFVVSDTITKQVLINRMRTAIFSTALPPISLMWSSFVIRQMASNAMRRRRKNLLAMCTLFDNRTQIVPIMAGENSRALEMSKRLKEAGYWVTPVRYPTVPKGKARIRVSLSAEMNKDMITKFIEVCNRIG